MVKQNVTLDSGVIKVNSNGSYEFTPNSTLNHTTNDNFIENLTYKVTDGDGDISSEATLTITVTDTLVTATKTK